LPGKQFISIENRFIFPGNFKFSRRIISFFRRIDPFPIGIESVLRENSLFPGEQVSVLPGNFKFSRRIISFLRGIDPFPSGNESVFRENGLFPGESYHSSGNLSYFPENSISFPGKRSVANGNYLFPVGNWIISRRIIPFLREISLFPGESYRFPGKIKLFYLETIICFFDSRHFLKTKNLPRANCPGKGKETDQKVELSGYH
jgi:hypothetical protein